MLFLMKMVKFSTSIIGVLREGLKEGTKRRGERRDRVSVIVVVDKCRAGVGVGGPVVVLGVHAGG